MNKIFAVIRREYTERVRTKAFVISTLLLPALITFMAVVPALLMRGGDRTSRVALVDGTTDGVGAQAQQALAAQRLSDAPGASPRYEITRIAAAGRVDAVRDSLVALTGFPKSKMADSWDGVLVVTDTAVRTGKVGYFGNNVGS
ncbi:MAG: hypothetical protein ABJC19_08020, partial [Gemmatimonadota bacterium]